MRKALVLATLLALLLCQAAHASGGSRLRDRDDKESDRRHHSHEDEDEDEYDEHHHRHDEDEDAGKKSKESPFILRKPVEIARTEAGRIQVLPGRNERGGPLALKNIGLNFVTMEPRALLLPQYIDAPFVLYVFKGRMRLGLVKGNDLQQQDMEEGDVYVVPGGLVFYILNTDEAQRLRVFGIFDTSESLEAGYFQSIFIAGGIDPKTTLHGFDREVLAAAFKVTPEEVSDVLENQNEGPIIYTSKSRYLELSSRAKWSPWSLVNLASEFFNLPSNDGEKKKPFNLLKKKPDFRNDNGRTVAINGKEYSPLHKANVGVFAVSLKPAAVLAPHWNPRAAELAIVTAGEGVIQISYPNGTNALNERVEEGTVFFVPRYFPMCQIASRNGDFEFVGFSTSSRPNHPQFLAGASSVLQALDIETMSMAFGVKQDKLRDFLDRQKDAIIVPGFIEEDNSTRATF